jgi:hypothetical protein
MTTVQPPDSGEAQGTSEASGLTGAVHVRLQHAIRLFAAYGALGKDDFMQLEPVGFLASCVFSGQAARVRNPIIVILISSQRALWIEVKRVCHRRHGIR